MTTLHKYRVYCETEEIYVDQWSDVEPTVCPNNNTHPVTTDLTSVEETVVEEIHKVEIQGKYYQDGRLSIHVTPKLKGLTTYETGRGDNRADVTDVGGGAVIKLQHAKKKKHEDPVNLVDGFYVETLYIDFNCWENRSAIYSCELLFNNMHYALASCTAVPVVTPSTPGSNTNYMAVPYNKVNGAFIVYGAGGGNTSITPGDEVLVPVVTNYDPDAPAPIGYWNADPDPENPGQYINITPANGDGGFNMFAAECPLSEGSKFVNDRQLNCPGRSSSSIIGSKDAQELPHNSRFKIELKVPEDDDQSCDLAINLLMFRKKTF